MSRWLIGLGSLVALTYTVRAVRRQSARSEARMSARRQDAMLDDALDDSFPASDPPALTNPHC